VSNDNQKMAAIAAQGTIEIELSTRPALRLWEGREKTDKRHGILGLPGFCKIMRGIEQSVRNDDPYADYYYEKIEQGVDSLALDLDRELKDVESYLDENVPPAMRLPSVGSDEPTVVPVRFASRLGFQMVYQILKVDQIVLKVLVANHIGLLPNKAKFETIARVEKRVRSLMHMIFSYRHTGVTRDDMAANNQKAQKAVEAMGDLEQGYLDGSVRSENAPPLPMKRLQTLGGQQNKNKGKEKTPNSQKNLDSDENSVLAAELDNLLSDTEEVKKAANA